MVSSTWSPMVARSTGSPLSAETRLRHFDHFTRVDQVGITGAQIVEVLFDDLSPVGVDLRVGGKPLHPGFEVSLRDLPEVVSFRDYHRLRQLAIGWGFDRHPHGFICPYGEGDVRTEERRGGHGHGEASVDSCAHLSNVWLETSRWKRVTMREKSERSLT